MLKVFYKKHYITVDNNDWERIDFISEVITDEGIEDEFVFEDLSFNECRKRIEKDGSLLNWNMWNDETTFLHKPIICFGRGYHAPLKYKHFEKISYKICYEEKENITMEYVLKHFPAEQGIQYFKERGLNVCPMLKE